MPAAAKSDARPRRPEADFDNPERWEIVGGINVFKEHNEFECADCSAESRSRGKQPGHQEKPFRCQRHNRDAELVRRFDRPRLEKIAANCNELDRKGQPPALSLGHTRDGPDGKPLPESEQPPIAGYGRKWRVQNDPAHGCLMVRADFYLAKDREKEARTYPRVSPEHWRVRDTFDPVALIRVTPDMDLGNWTYGRDGTEERYRYARTEDWTMDPTAVPDAAAPGDEEYQKFARCMARYEAEKAKMSAAAAAPAAAPVAAAPAMPSATNMAPAAPAAPPEKKEPEHELVRSFRQELEAERARYQQMKAEDNARLTALEKEGRLARYSADLAELRRTYLFNKAEALLECQDFDQAAFDRYKRHIEKYEKDPAGGPRGLLRTYVPPDEGAPDPNAPVTEAELDEVTQYMRSKGECDVAKATKEWRTQRAAAGR